MSLTIVQVAYPFAPVSRDAAGGPEQILALLDEALTGLGHRSVVAAGMSAEAAWRDALLGDAAPTLALMRVLLAGMPAAELESGLRGLGGDRAARLRRVAASHLGGIASLERMVAAGARHGPAGLASIRDMFDRLVRISPEASVAAYSPGDPGLRDAATAEVAAWMRGRGLLAGRPDLLDFGCGIGRFCLAFAPEARTVLGLDLSPGMVEAARRRCAGQANIRIEAFSGEDLAGVPGGAFDLMLAADVFPYLVQAGWSVVVRHLGEASRVLRTGGSLVILNFDYGDADASLLPALASAAGFSLPVAGETPFRLWDAAAFVLRKKG
ncbi:MAG TPA: methyltransferase domain-containing protein [Acetobacteraceae bacterium]|nr:methyltransferase domain-containing protein [Acetobacteraceae bacterium]